MSDPEYDLIIFGASGYTGQYVLEEVGRISEGQSLKYAIAGRNKSKLQSCLEVASKNANIDFSCIDIIIADVNDPGSLLSMARRAKIVINCVGPYRFHGIKMVEACIEAGTDHIDISGEPEYLEKVQLQFSEKAKDKKVCVVGSCGFDSIPADMGTLYLQNHFGGDVNSVDMIVGFDDTSVGDAPINVTTLECALHGYANRKQLGGIRRELFKEKLPRPSYRTSPKGSVWWSKESNRWCVTNMASDRSVVLRTQRLNYDLFEKRPLQFDAYFGMLSLWTAIGSMLFGLVFAVMAPFAITRNLFLRFPSFFSFGLFSRNGPNRDDLKGIKFCATFIGKGWNTFLKSSDEQHTEPPNVTKIAQVIGPDPGYFGTAIMITQCALTLLEERDKLPQQGGVFTAGSAFYNTSLIKRLEKQGIKFQMVESAK